MKINVYMPCHLCFDVEQRGCGKKICEDCPHVQGSRPGTSTSTPIRNSANQLFFCEMWTKATIRHARPTTTRSAAADNTAILDQGSYDYIVIIIHHPSSIIHYPLSSPTMIGCLGGSMGPSSASSSESGRSACASHFVVGPSK